MERNLLNEIKDTLLMGPGPSMVPPEVYEALGRTTLGHLDPYFIRIMDSIKEQLKTIFNTKNTLTVPMSGTGSSGMETCFVNLVEPGDDVLVLKNGVFGMRMQDVASRLGANVDTLEFEWGTPVDPQAVRKQVKEKNYRIVAVVHAETSTGVVNPVAEIGGIVKEIDALYLVDTVTSLGGMEVALDSWGADAAYSGTQKCLSCPPGLAPVSFSDKAVNALKNRKSKVPNWYLDLSMIINYWEGSKRSYHHTAPINMLYALYQALYQVLAEGLENAYSRHLDTHRYLIEKLGDLGLGMYVKEGSRLPMLNAVNCPEGADEAEIRGKLLSDYSIEIGGGLGPLAGKIWRIGIMGHTARKENVDKFADALKTLL
jgi:alanine-glyoxylate transaminase / serine-glyoxylate transaminase / serine-pyruvate transaminase